MTFTNKFSYSRASANLSHLIPHGCSFTFNILFMPQCTLAALVKDGDAPLPFETQKVEIVSNGASQKRGHIILSYFYFK